LSDSSHAGSTYEDGRRAGLAVAAFALAVMSFVNLLGLEKSLLAGVLAILALQGRLPGMPAPGWARPAIAIAVVHAITFVTVLILLRDKLGQLLLLLHKLG